MAEYSTHSIVALVLGILAFLLGWVPVLGWAFIITAIVFGILGIHEGGKGRSLAIGGLIAAGIGALSAILLILFFILGMFMVTTNVETGGTYMEERTEQADGSATRLVVLGGTGQVHGVDGEDPVSLEVGGDGNRVVVARGTPVDSVTIHGTRNIIQLPAYVDPRIDDQGQDTRITYG